VRHILYSDTALPLLPARSGLRRAPTYPGASQQANYSMQSNEGYAGSIQFTTKDSMKAVLSFYC